MKDAQAVLQEYLPLELHQMHAVHGGTYQAEPVETDPRLLSYTHFEWMLDSERRSDYKSELYDKGPHILCGSDRRSNQLAEHLKGALLRLPKISYCFGSRSLLIENSLLEGLNFADNLGVIQADVTLIDATLTSREGYTTLSFHKRFTPERIEQRLAQLPASQRPIICMKRNNDSDVIMVHKNVLATWQKNNITEVNYEPKLDNLTALLEEKYYHGNSEAWLEYYSVESYQRDENLE